MILEGVVFTAGQLALLDLLDDRLPGLQRGTELVLRDERWHVGFGARCLADSTTTRRRSSTRASAAALRPSTGRVMDGCAAAARVRRPTQCSNAAADARRHARSPR